MKKMSMMLAVSLSAAVALSAPVKIHAAQQSTSKADNTQKNAEKGVTAEQQKENKTDREITREIRRSVVKDKSLSIKAHNVKIITKDGHVTLKGPVKNADEKKAVEKAAEEVVGKGKITNEIEIAPAKTKKGKKEDKEKKEQTEK
ncbi:BON domain-containing protein [Geomonas ferrireducens]|uniref:BON domain-containing protein n=1 Tax=Geomonas ferrireducens TaxID=2570227 RepID=UPI0010A916D6|nr:BON domain-containing protein [Geomonas ferrireducens]